MVPIGSLTVGPEDAYSPAAPRRRAPPPASSLSDPSPGPLRVVAPELKGGFDRIQLILTSSSGRTGATGSSSALGEPLRQSASPLFLHWTNEEQRAWSRLRELVGECAQRDSAS